MIAYFVREVVFIRPLDDELVGRLKVHKTAMGIINGLRMCVERCNLDFIDYPELFKRYSCIVNCSKPFSLAHFRQVPL